MGINSKIYKMYYAVLPLKKEELKRINRYLSHIPKNESECLGEDEVITHTVVFPNKVAMDIKCCGVQFEEGRGRNNCAWTESVLFDKHGCEISFSDVEEEYDGQWRMHDNDGNTYVVIVTSIEEYEKWHNANIELPDKGLPVLVTYKSYYDGTLISDSSAFYRDGHWFWADWVDEDSEPVSVDITHWRYLPNGPQYVCS